MAKDQEESSSSTQIDTGKQKASEVDLAGDENLIWEEDEIGTYRIVDANGEGNTYLGIAISDPSYPNRNYTADETETPPLKKDPAFWTNLVEKIENAESEEKKKEIFLEHALGNPIDRDDDPYSIRENIVIPKLDSKSEAFLQKALWEVFTHPQNRIDEADLAKWGTRARGRLFYIRNKLGFDRPHEKLFSAAGIMDPDQEAKIISRGKRFVAFVETNPDVQRYCKEGTNLMELSLDEQERLVNDLVKKAATVHDIPVNLLPTVQVGETDRSNFVAQTERKISGAITLSKNAFAYGMVSLLDTIFHETTHVLQNDRRWRFNSSQTPAIPSTMLQDAKKLGQAKISKDEKYSVLATSIDVKPDTYHDFAFVSQNEREAFLGGLGVACYAAASPIINPKQAGVIKELSPEEMIGGFENKVGEFLQKKMGASLRQLVTRTSFIDAADSDNTKCNPISVQKAMTALLEFREMAEEPANAPLSCTHALLSCLPALVKKACNPKDECYAQSALLVGIIRHKERISGKDAFVSCVEEQNPGFKFSTDPNNFRDNDAKNVEKEKLQALAQRYPDHLSRAILAQAAWHALNKPKDISLKSIQEMILSAPTKKITPRPLRGPKVRFG